jgi:hypothetical protein
MNFTEWFVNQKLDIEFSWFKSNLLLETIVGSQAYGCSGPNSDYDIYCIVMPRPEHLWPQKYGYILNLDECPNFRRKELKGADSTTVEDKKVEIEWISLIEFFKLAGLECSPNLTEILFVKRNLVTVSSKVGWLLRDNRKLFISAKSFHTFKHYANAQMSRIRTRKPVSTERRELIEKMGYDVKMAYHIFRLQDELEQMITIGDIDLMRNKDECKLMKYGKWGDFDRFEKVYQSRMDNLEVLSRKCTLPLLPQADSLRKLLHEIIEEYYGNETNFAKVSEAVSAKDVMNMLNKIDDKLNSIVSVKTNFGPR